MAVPRSYLEQELPGGGSGGLQHAYALTTHAAQGATFALSSPLISDQASPEGVYVAITRGTHDLHAAVIDAAAQMRTPTEDDLPILAQETTALERTARSLANSARPHLALSLLGQAPRCASERLHAADPQVVAVDEVAVRWQPVATPILKS